MPLMYYGNYTISRKADHTKKKHSKTQKCSNVYLNIAYIMNTFFYMKIFLIKTKVVVWRDKKENITFDTVTRNDYLNINDALFYV